MAALHLNTFMEGLRKFQEEQPGKMNRLEKLVIVDNVFSPEDVEFLIDTLPKCPRLLPGSVSIGGWELKPVDADRIAAWEARSLRLGKVLKQLIGAVEVYAQDDLCWNSLCFPMLKAVRGAKHLEDINLSTIQNFDDGSAKELAGLLLTWPCLRLLDLSDLNGDTVFLEDERKFTARGARLLFTKLKDCRVLREIDLSNSLNSREDGDDDDRMEQEVKLCGSVAFGQFLSQLPVGGERWECDPGPLPRPPTNTWEDRPMHYRLLMRQQAPEQTAGQKRGRDDDDSD